MADISEIVRVSFSLGQRKLLDDNMNICAVITSEQGNVLSTTSRYRMYSNASQVATDFGTNSNAYAHALTFFAQSPNAYDAGGEFYIAYWRKNPETYSGTSATLTTHIIDDTTISSLSTIQNGAFSIKIDGIDTAFAGLDFTDVESLADIRGVIAAALDPTKINVTLIGSRLVFASASTGMMSMLDYPSDSPNSDGIVTILRMTQATGATLKQGEAGGTKAPEKPIDAVNALLAEVPVKGMVFADEIMDTLDYTYEEAMEAIATLAAQQFLVYEVITPDKIAFAKSIRLKGLTYLRMLYNFTSDKRPLTAYMSRRHTINHNATDSNETMHLRLLTGITPTYLSPSESAAIRREGVSTYEPFKRGIQELSRVYESGSNGWSDIMYNIIALKNSVQIAVFNTLDGATVPQTNVGIDRLSSAIKTVLSRFVRAGVIAPGTWNGGTFGNEAIFEQNIANTGFYVLIGSLSAQSQADRSARKAPPIQIATKFAGAIHSASIIMIGEE